MKARGAGRPIKQHPTKYVNRPIRPGCTRVSDAMSSSLPPQYRIQSSRSGSSGGKTRTSLADLRGVCQRPNAEELSELKRDSASRVSFSNALSFCFSEEGGATYLRDQLARWLVDLQGIPLEDAFRMMPVEWFDRNYRLVIWKLACQQRWLSAYLGDHHFLPLASQHGLSFNSALLQLKHRCHRMHV